MTDRREYQREVSQLLQDVELRTQRLYRLRAAGAGGRAVDGVSEELDEARRRLARLVGSG